MAKLSKLPRWTTMCLLVGLLALSTVVTVDADLPTNKSRLLADNGKSPAARTDTPKDADTERVVLQLVKTHLPELTPVLQQLRTAKPREYELAIKDLARAARKLELARNRDQRLFELEVELLQAEQQASLLTARLKVRDSQSDRTKLREAAKRLHQAQIARAEYDVEFYRQRLSRNQQQLDAAIGRLDNRKTDAETQLEKSFLNMLRKAGRELNRDDAQPSGSAKRPGRTALETETNPPSSDEFSPP